MLRFYHYDKCDTCRRARKWLDAKGVAYEALPIRETPPTRDEFKAVLAATGDMRKLFNTSGQDYKELGMKDKLPGLTEDEALALLATRGNLVKRPFLVGAGVALAGFKEDEWAAALERQAASKK